MPIQRVTGVRNALWVVAALQRLIGHSRHVIGDVCCGSIDGIGWAIRSNGRVTYSQISTPMELFNDIKGL